MLRYASIRYAAFTTLYTSTCAMLCWFLVSSTLVNYTHSRKPRPVKVLAV